MYLGAKVATLVRLASIFSMPIIMNACGSDRDALLKDATGIVFDEFVSITQMPVEVEFAHVECMISDKNGRLRSWFERFGAVTPLGLEYRATLFDSSSYERFVATVGTSDLYAVGGKSKKKGWRLTAVFGADEKIGYIMIWKAKK